MLMGMTPIFIGVTIFCGLIYLMSLVFRSINKMSYSYEIIWGNLDLIPSSALVLGFFTGMCVTAWVYVLLARKNYTLLKYLSYQAGWGTLDGGEKSEETIYLELEDAYRKNYIQLDDSSQTHDLIHKILFERTSPFWRKSAIILTGLTLILFVFDMRHFSFITPDNVVMSPYNKLSTLSYSTKDIQEIDRRCYIGLSDNNLRASLQYNVILPDGKKIDLMNKEKDVLQADKYLRSYFDIKRPALRVDVFERGVNIPATLDICKRHLGRNSDAEFQELVKTVFGL